MFLLIRLCGAQADATSLVSYNKVGIHTSRKANSDMSRLSQGLPIFIVGKSIHSEIVKQTTEALEGHFYLLLITYYLLLITYHLLLITHYLSLITYFLLLIISFITPLTAGNSKYTFPVTAVAVVVVVVVVAVYL